MSHYRYFFYNICPTKAQYVLTILLIYTVHLLDKQNEIVQSARYVHQDCRYSSELVGNQEILLTVCIHTSLLMEVSPLHRFSRSEQIS